MYCEICGGEDFEKHAGFMYCTTCQTQSQDYHEQEYEYQDNTVGVVSRRRFHFSKSKSTKPTFYDDGLWTSWEGFNYILYGMTKEMKKCGASEEFEEIVFKLWAAYLKECQVAFISKYQEKIPKLGFSFKNRDARILYNFDLSVNHARERRSRSCSKTFNSSASSISSQSKKAIGIQREKMMEAEYQDHLSKSVQSSSTLANETLESLGKISEDEESGQYSDENEILGKSFKLMLSKKDYKMYKNSSQSRKLEMKAKEKAIKNVKFPGKNKLLSIIHLALLMTGSQIQLSDLLRFIRESHLSYAKVTHFFPHGMKFAKKDFSYMEVTSDNLMPTHSRQRMITSQLAHLLKVETILTPDMNKLIHRYCQDLNLPTQIAELSKRISATWVPLNFIPKSKTPSPNYEAWAMVSIIFVIKLLFGINGRTEIFFSCLASEVNSLKNSDYCLFVFKDWQNFIECRKSLLTNFHYPTQEQLGGFFRNSRNFLDMLMKESKDEYRGERFIPYPKYYIEENLLSGVKQTLSALSQSQNVPFSEFQPSLTPLVSHTETAMRYLSKEPIEIEEETNRNKFLKALPMDILKQSFENCDLKFVFEPESYLKLVKKTSDLWNKFGISNAFLDEEKHENQEFLLNCSSKYWIFEYRDSSSSFLTNFKEDILEKTCENFQWLLTECARMLEMNVRDLYVELLQLENKLKSKSLITMNEFKNK